MIFPKMPTSLPTTDDLPIGHITFYQKLSLPQAGIYMVIHDATLGILSTLIGSDFT